jgi:DNA-binding transcriptional MocR family regulator
MLVPGLRIDPDSLLPVYRQIADGVVTAAKQGKIEPGHRLPPTRDLARDLGVNRQTVVAAYEYLAAEGLVSSHTGKGTFLARPSGPGVPATESAATDTGWLPAFSRAVEGSQVGGLLSIYQTAIRSDGISFAGSYPAPELLPVELFAAAMSRTLGEGAERFLTYGPTAGHLPLREQIAAQMREAGSKVESENLLVTNGAQQAIELVFHTFLERGDTVVIEEPTYTGALSVLSSIGARVVSVPVDEGGMRPDLLAIALERHRPRLLYVQPTFQNPTTAVMNEYRRRELLDLAARSRTIVLEDDWAHGVRFSGRELPTLHALDPDHVIYVSTFSKKLLPGLRVGWIAARSRMVERLIALKQIRDCGTSPLLQAALHTFLDRDGMTEHLQRVLPAYRERRDCMLAAMDRHFPDEVLRTRPEGGLFVWVTLPRNLDGENLFQAAQARDVIYSKGDLFHSNADGSHTLRLTYSTASPSQIEAGVQILGTLIRERWPGRSEPPPRNPAESMPIL